jgi:hypothetical protein
MRGSALAVTAALRFRRGGRESFDVWLEVSTGLVKLIRQADA